MDASKRPAMGPFAVIALLGWMTLASSGCVAASREGNPMDKPTREPRTRMWIASLRIMGLFRTDEAGNPLVADWDFVSESIEGIKFWDGQIDAKSDEELRAIFADCRRRGLRIAYEKGRWPLPEDLFELEVARQTVKRGSKDEAFAHIHRDRGRMLASFEPEVWARTAAEPEVARLKRIRDAGGVELMDFIDLDGAFLKNIFPYTFALTQGGLTDAPEEKRFERGFRDPAAFVTAFRRMVEIIRTELPEARHVMWRHLPNVHFWTYLQAVRAEETDDGRTVYRNVDFHRFREHTLDFAGVLPLIAANRDLFVGVTTDYPWELYRRPEGNARYRGVARDAMATGLSFCPILTAMSAKDGMEAWSSDVRAYADAVLRDVKPDMILLQSWGEHPTWEDFLKPESDPTGFLGLAAAVIRKVDAAADSPGPAPRIFVGPEELARLKARANTAEEPFAAAWAKVREAADEALGASPGVYDGENSVELRFAGLAAMGRVRDLCLAYEATRDPRYAAKARELFAAWPHHAPAPGSRLVSVPYAGQDRGDTVAGLGLNVGMFATDVCSAYSLVWEQLSPRERAATERWLRFLAGLIREGHEAWITNDYYGKQDFNNHLSGHNMGLAAIGFALGERALVDYAIDSPDNPRDWKEMHDGAILMASKPDREQLWHGDPTLTKGAQRPADGEIYDRYRVVTVRKGRGCGMPYAFFHGKMLTQTAEIARQNGVDLYGYTGPNGENLLRTYEAYAPHLLKQEPVARSGYYAGNRVYEAQVHMYELAGRRYPGNERIREVLGTLNRVVEDQEAFGWASVLLYGE